MANRVILVRHGETEWSLSGQHTGRTDIPLTDNGKEQARRVCAGLAGNHFDLVLASPLARAVETARLAGLGDQVETTEDLVEWDYGDYDGRTTADIRIDRPGWSLFTDGVPGGESVEDVGNRVDRVIERARALFDQGADGDVSLFAHGHVLRILAARWVGLAPADGRRFALDPATVSVLSYERETPVISRWNDPDAAHV